MPLRIIDVLQTLFELVSSWVKLKQTRCRVSTTLNPHPVVALSIERSRNERSRNASYK
jgi:hypothetical protein